MARQLRRSTGEGQTYLIPARKNTTTHASGLIVLAGLASDFSGLSYAVGPSSAILGPRYGLLSQEAYGDD